MYDIIIIGAGPAGLTSAIYGARDNKKILVLEANVYGGQIVNTSNIANYPALPNVSGYNFATNMYNQALELNADIKFEKVIKVDILKEEKIIYTEQNTYKSKAIIIATGARNRKLNIANEQELIGKGISYCATCDGAFYKDKDVAIVGGGNTALEDGIFLSRLCHKVYLIHRNSNFKGDALTLDELKKKNNVEIITNATIKNINGSSKLESIDITCNEKIVNIKIMGLFIAIGQEPNSNLFKDMVALDNYGYIKSLDECHTNIPGVYVAGDVRSKKIRQLTTATSDGTIAMLTALSEIK